jgi:hypothetical protein
LVSASCGDVARDDRGVLSHADQRRRLALSEEVHAGK